MAGIVAMLSNSTRAFVALTSLLGVAGCAVADTTEPRTDARADRPSRTDSGTSTPDVVTEGECIPGEIRDCYTGPDATAGIGACRLGSQTCGASRTWNSACVGERTPAATEVCGNSVDDDCDADTDEDCGECMPGQTRMCYSGAAGTMGVGVCRGGTQTCDAMRRWSAACEGEVTPSMELCDSPMDENCNGMTDEMCGECTPGDTRPCYGGAAGTAGRGICREGTQTCGTARAWLTSCPGEVRPQAAEVCDNAQDDNCNGSVDEMCGECSPGATRSCYTGAAGTMGVGVCRAGTQTCSASRAWGSCAGEVRPGTEVCTNSTDDNCNGTVNEGCVTAPSNNARASAIALTLGNTELTRTGSTTGATYDGPAAGGCWSCTNQGDVWFSFTLSERAVVYADTAGSSFDTILQITDSSGARVSGTDACKDDAGCSVGGFTSTLQSRVWAALNAGTYYISVGGCGTGNFTLHVQRLLASMGSFVYTASPLSGSGNTPMTSLIGSSRRVSTTCSSNLGPSGEDVRFFLTCGGQQQFFSLCPADGGSFTRRIGTTNYDPILSLYSANSGVEVSCNDDGPAMGGTNCAGTGGDTINYGSRLNNIVAPRGLNAVVIDERYTTNGMGYSLNYVIR